MASRSVMPGADYPDDTSGDERVGCLRNLGTSLLGRRDYLPEQIWGKIQSYFQYGDWSKARLSPTLVSSSRGKFQRKKSKSWTRTLTTWSIPLISSLLIPLFLWVWFGSTPPTYVSQKERTKGDVERVKKLKAAPVKSPSKEPVKEPADEGKEQGKKADAKGDANNASADAKPKSLDDAPANKAEPATAPPTKEAPDPPAQADEKPQDTNVVEPDKQSISNAATQNSKMKKEKTATDAKGKGAAEQADTSAPSDPAEPSAKKEVNPRQSPPPPPRDYLTPTTYVELPRFPPEQSDLGMTLYTCNSALDSPPFKIHGLSGDLSSKDGTGSFKNSKMVVKAGNSLLATFLLEDTRVHFNWRTNPSVDDKGSAALLEACVLEVNTAGTPHPLIALSSKVKFPAALVDGGRALIVLGELPRIKYWTNSLRKLPYHLGCGNMDSSGKPHTFGLTPREVEPFRIHDTTNGVPLNVYISATTELGVGAVFLEIKDEKSPDASNVDDFDNSTVSAILYRSIDIRDKDGKKTGQVVHVEDVVVGEPPEES